MNTPAPAQEKEWHVVEVCNELAIVHKLPGELRIIAAMVCPGLDEDTMKRYARMIVNTLNAAREFVHRCEAGEILSKTSYAAFKSALEGVPRKPSTAEVVERETI